MATAVEVPRRFCGPPASANGGYACGLVAAAVEGPCEVTLRSPPPLETPMELHREDGRVELRHAGQLVAEGRATVVDLVLPGRRPGVEEARRAGDRYPWADRHPYPGCFVCGPARKAGDGLRIGPGPTDDATAYATTWAPGADLADAAGVVRPEFVWSALDCPSGIVTDLLGEVGVMLLGRLAADLRAPVCAGAEHVVLAWPRARDGRKLHTASALLDADGAVLAVARATWIELAGTA